MASVLTSIADTVAQIRTGEIRRRSGDQWFLPPSVRDALLSGCSPVTDTIANTAAFLSIPIRVASPSVERVMEEMGIMAILGPPLDGTHPPEEYCVVKKGAA